MAEVIRNGGKLRAFEHSMHSDPDQREDFEGLFGGVWLAVEGLEFSWAEGRGERERKCVVL